MALTKECCCWGCRNVAQLPEDLTQDDVRSAVVCCDACTEAGCDPFEETGARCQDAPEGEDDAEEPAERFPCPIDACAGEGHLLGVLGRLAHYRCRACGVDFNL
jgi:hypothetical protein